MSVRIVVVTAKGKFEHEIDKDYISVGRGKDNDLQIDDLSVSRRHAIIEKDETGKIFITDLNSSNGTFVNNVRINQKTPITSNDHILLGKATIVIEVPEAAGEGTMRVDAAAIREKLKEASSTQKSESIPVPPPVQSSTPPTPPPVQTPQPPQTPPVQSVPVPPPVQPATPPVHTHNTADFSGGAKSFKFGGIGARFVALLIDSIVITVPLMIINMIIGKILFSMGIWALASVLIMILDIVVAYGYFTYCYAAFGQTLGKKLLGLYVVDQQTGKNPTFKQAFIRTLVQGLISGIFLIGYIMAFFNPEHKTLHDMIAKTYVVKK